VGADIVNPERILPIEFFARPVLQLAPDLLGRHLVRMLDGRRMVLRITEVEAYGARHHGKIDRACHAWRGPTPRTEIMFGPPGRAYIYLIYGMHHCLNFVCAREGLAQAVLIRAGEPLEGEDLIAEHRGGQLKENWTSGPGRLAAALALTREENGMIIAPPTLWLEAGYPVARRSISRGKRIGIDYAGDSAAWPWRYWIAASQS
jgi:DNA-3-methyladenine glycosylase